jgi:hypothetical protein
MTKIKVNHERRERQNYGRPGLLAPVRPGKPARLAFGQEQARLEPAVS